MKKENMEVEFTKEEFEILKSVLLERSTFYTRKIVDLKFLQLKTDNIDFSNEFQERIDFNLKFKNAINKLYELL